MAMEATDVGSAKIGFLLVREAERVLTDATRSRHPADARWAG
jgi:hypothetical protein